MNISIKAKKYIVDMLKISEQEYDEIYSVYKKLFLFLDEVYPPGNLVKEIDKELIKDNSLYQSIFINLLKISKNGMSLFLDYVYILYTIKRNAYLIPDLMMKYLNDYLLRLGFYSKEYALRMKKTIAYDFMYAIETVIVYDYDKVMNSKIIPDYYKKIIKLYRDIYKKYGALQGGFLSFLLKDSFNYFVRNESIKNDFENVDYFLSLIYDDYNDFEDSVSLMVPNFQQYESFDQVYNSIPIPKKGIY